MKQAAQKSDFLKQDASAYWTMNIVQSREVSKKVQAAKEASKQMKALLLQLAVVQDIWLVPKI